MGLFSGIFKRKPGGTMFGNLLRGVAHQASGGVLGNGVMMISQEDAGKRDNAGIQPNVNPYLQQATGAFLHGGATGLNNLNQTGTNASNTYGGTFASNAQAGGIKSVAMQYGKYLVIIAGVLVFFFMLKKIIKK